MKTARRTPRHSNKRPDHTGSVSKNGLILEVREDGRLKNVKNHGIRMETAKLRPPRVENTIRIARARPQIGWFF
jgi:hypothetical protein